MFSTDKDCVERAASDTGGSDPRLSRLLAPVLLCLSGALIPLTVTAAPAFTTSTAEIGKYLVIGTGEGTGSDQFHAFHMSNVEIGADQELVSNSDVGDPSQRVGAYEVGGLDLTGTWVSDDGSVVTDGVGMRYDDLGPDHPDDTVGIPDELPRAQPVFEGIDWSGNVALTGEYAKFESANADVNADIGIQCNRTPAACFPSPSSDNSYFDEFDIGGEQDLNALAGVSQFDPLALIAEMISMRDFIVGLPTDFVLSEANLGNKDDTGFAADGWFNRNYKDDPYNAG